MHKQSHIQNLTLSTIASLKTVTGMTEGQICLTRDNNTIYRYIASGSAYTADDKYVLITASGGNTRWIAVGGTYSIFGGASNNSRFEIDGTFVSYGDAICYRDEYVGGEYFVPTGATAPDTVNATIGGVVTRKYAFDGVNTTEKLGNTFEIPHDIPLTAINAGTIPIEVHVHIGPSDNNTGDVRFTFDWCLIKANGAPIAGTQVVLTKTVTANQQYYNLLTGGNLAIPSGGFGIGDLIEFTLTRDPTNAADTYASDMLFYKIALHVPVDMLGSRTTYTK
jgi:hypothetical protein